MDPEVISLNNSSKQIALDAAALQAKLDALRVPPPPPPMLTSIAVLDELQALTGITESTGWVQPGNAGDSGGADSTKPHGTFVLTPGKVATFSAKPGYAYNNGYWYTKRKGAEFDHASIYLEQFHVCFPTAADIAACNALEFECQQSLDGNIYDAAWQIHRPGGDNTLRVFDKRPATHGWKPSGLPALPAGLWKPGVMVAITQTWRRNTDGTFSYLNLAINGVNLMPAPIVMPAWMGAGQANYFAVGFQLDTNSSATPYSVQVESFRVVYAG